MKIPSRIQANKQANIPASSLFQAVAYPSSADIHAYPTRRLATALMAAGLIGLLGAVTSAAHAVPLKPLMDSFSEATLRGQSNDGGLSMALVSGKNIKTQPWVSRGIGGTTLTVTNNSDSGAGTLRDALDFQTNSCYAGPITINFAIPTGGPSTDYVISPATPLPTITCAYTTIDGYSQAATSPNTATIGGGFNGSIGITITGSALSTPDSGIIINADYTTIKGLALTHFDISCSQPSVDKAGIFIAGGNGVTVAGNLIGVDVNGGGLGNCNGVTMTGGANATIGGAAPADRNIISANNNSGIYFGGGTGASAIRGNFIGVAPNRATPMANGGNHAILLSLPNAVVDGNYIAYNLGNGVGITGNGNGTILTNNEIAGNFQNGVAVLGTECTARGVSIRYNRIYVPGYLGIDLGGIGIPSGDDDNVRDTNGAYNSCYHGNSGQKYPVISAVTHNFQGTTGLTTVSFQLDSAPSSSYMLDVYDNSGTPVDTGNQGIGRNYSGTTGPWATDGSGTTGKVSVNFAGTIQHPTMTASTDPYSPSSGGTSEFSVQAPTPLTFLTTGYTNYGTTGTGTMSQTFTFRNDDVNTVNVPLPTFDAPEFTVTSPACGNVAAGASCNIVVAFSKPAPGTVLATMTLGPVSSSGAPPLPVVTQATQTVTVGLSGTAAAGTPAVTIAGSGSFPSTIVGASSAVQAVTITNSGSANLILNSLAVDVSGIFVDTTGGPPPSSTHWCGFGSSANGDPLTGPPITLAPAASCTLNLVFKPSASISYSATLTVNSNAATSPNTLALSGTGLPPPPTYAPTSLDFGSVTVGVTSSPQTATFANSSPGTVSLTGISFNGGGVGFNVLGSSQCLSVPTLAPGASCTFDITATPIAVGLLSDSVYVGTSPAIIAVPANLQLTVTGVAPVPIPPTVALSITPSTVSTGGAVPLVFTITTPVANGFTGGTFTFNHPAGVVTAPIPNIVSSCGGTITSAPGSTTVSAGGLVLGASNQCQISLNVGSLSVGTYNFFFAAGDLTTSSGSNTAASTATLTVTAAPTPAVTLTPPSVVFGARPVNTTSPTSVVSLGNSGGALLNITSITPNGDFAVVTSCPLFPSSLPVGQACPLNITFTPLTVSASLTGNVTIVSDAPGSPHIVPLSGAGTATPVPVVTLSTTLLSFPSQVIGSTSTAQIITVFNSGFANLNFSSITKTGSSAFTRVVPLQGPLAVIEGIVPTNPDCNFGVAPGGSCTITVTFTPSAAGTVTGQVNIASNAGGSPHVVNLTGTGISTAVPIISTPGSLNFGDQIILTGGAQALNITNSGGATLTISSITVSGANASNFVTSGTCVDIVTNATCSVVVTFTPATVGAKAAQITIVSNASNLPTTTVALTGTGILAPRPITDLSVTAIGYGNAIFGGASSGQVITLKNTGGLGLQIQSVFTTGDFVVMNSCPTVLSSGNSCVINVSFSPLRMGQLSGELVLISNAQGSPHRIPLSGTGCRWFSQAQSRFFLTSCG